ncbi:MAG TPA: flagellar biosynthetic protein FliO [Clostridiales bacterium]|nr:flagellar biosynthetic protein FliO [Clostridiales bacterium]
MVSETMFAISQTNELNNWSELLWRFITFIFAFVLIIVIAYIITKFIGKKSMIFTTGRNLKIVERVSLGLDKSLYIIRLEDYFYLIAVGKQNVEFIDKLSKDEIDISSEGIENFHSSVPFQPKFDSYLRKYFTKKKEVPADHETGKKEMLSLQKKLQQLKAQYEEFKQKTNKKDEDEQK